MLTHLDTRDFLHGLNREFISLFEAISTKEDDQVSTPGQSRAILMFYVSHHRYDKCAVGFDADDGQTGSEARAKVQRLVRQTSHKFSWQLTSFSLVCDWCYQYASMNWACQKCANREKDCKKEGLMSSMQFVNKVSNFEAWYNIDPGYPGTPLWYGVPVKIHLQI